MDEFNNESMNGINNENTDNKMNENSRIENAGIENTSDDNAAVIVTSTEAAGTAPAETASAGETAAVYQNSFPQASGADINSQPVSGHYPPKNQAYYTENIKKTKNKKIGAGQLILVSLLSSLLGASAMFAATMFLAPVIRPTIDEWFGTSAQAAEVVGADNGIYKKVEITQSSSPVEAIAEKVSPSIVSIQVTVQAQGNGFFFNLGQEGVGYGSGIIIREDGYILTNNHVIENALEANTNRLAQGSKIEVILPGNKDKAFTAKIVGRDDNTDIAVLKIEASNLPAAELGDSDKVKAGELAVAIGNPGGLEYMGSITAGIISGIDRTLLMDNGREFKLIQTDAAINPGNSGGALVNSQGQVIGVNTVKIAATDVEGIGFAIPINEANTIADSLINFKYVKGRPYLGVMIDQTFTEETAKKYNVPFGLMVYEVQPLTAAYKAGIHTGDIITRFNGKPVKVFKDLEDEKNRHKPGDEVEIEVYRDKKTLTLKVVLDEEKQIE